MSLFKGIRYFLVPSNNKTHTLKEILGFYPKKLALYEQAFTHKSIVNEQNDDEKLSNERLEFLGDAVLGAIVAEYFYNKYPFQDEGFLSKMRSRLVSRSFLNKLAVDLGLDVFLETSADTSRTKSIFGDAFEALIGAIYLDKGYKACKKFVIEKIIKDYIDIPQLIEQESDFKSKLVEWCQKQKQSFEFKVTESNHQNIKHYSCELFIEGRAVSEGLGNSKKRSEQDAAKKYFQQNLPTAKV